MKDDRDAPRVETDANGDRFYITEDGKRIRITSDEAAEALRELEEHLRRERMFPMGMK
jgi:hypothetical protein